MAKKIHRLGSHAMATEFQILILDTSEPKALASASELALPKKLRVRKTDNDAVAGLIDDGDDGREIF